MFRKQIFILLMAVLIIACSDNDGNKRAQELYLQARELLRSGEVERAKDIFEMIIVEYPQSNIALKADENLQQIHTTYGSLNIQVDNAIKEKIDENKTDETIVTNQTGEEIKEEIRYATTIDSAKELLTLEKYKEATVILTDLIATEPEKGEYYYYLGQAYEHMEKFQEALDMYYKASERNYNVGSEAIMDYYLLNNDLAQAEKYAQKIVLLNDRSLHDKSRLILAICMASRNEKTKAEELAKAIDKNYLQKLENQSLYNYYLGLLYKGQDRLGAISCFEKVGGQQKDNRMATLATLQIAQIYIENNDKRAAVQILKPISDKDIIKIALAKIFLAEGRNYEAIKYCEEIASKNNNANDIQKILVLLSQYNETDAVHKIAQKAVEAFPQEEFFQMVIADIYMKKRMWVLAEKYYHSALQQAKDLQVQAKLSFLLARIATYRGQYSEAIIHLKKAIDNNPLDLPSRLLLAEVYLTQKEYEKALDVYDQSLQIFSETEQQKMVQLQIASTYSFMNKWDIVKQKVTDLLQKHPDFLQAKTMRAIAYQKLGQHNEAIRLYKELIETSKGQETGVIANNLASSLADHKLELDYAEELAKKACQILRLPQTFDTLAWVYYQQGKYEESKELLEKLLSYNKKDPYLNYHYGLVLIKENSSLAKQHFQIVIDESDHTFKHYNECREILSNIIK